MSAPPARKIAFEVLLRVETGGAYASRALDAALAQAGALDPREAGLATELVYGTLRRALALDAALAPHSRRPLAELDPAARVALRLGAYQLLHLGTPAHAAVGETVALAKEVEHGRAAGYVNAVLRALARAPVGPPPPPLEADPAGHVAAAEALPRWLAEEWVAWLGPDEALALARGMNAPAPLSARAPERDALLARVRAAGLARRPGGALARRVVLAGGSVADLARAAGGLPFQVQDEAAQLVTLFAAGRPARAARARPRRLRRAGREGVPPRGAARPRLRGRRDRAPPAQGGRAREGGAAPGARGARRLRRRLAARCPASRRGASTRCSWTRPAPASAPSGATRS